MNATLAVIGAGGQARGIADTARETSERELIELFDDPSELYCTSARKV